MRSAIGPQGVTHDSDHDLNPAKASVSAPPGTLRNMADIHDHTPENFISAPAGASDAKAHEPAAHGPLVGIVMGSDSDWPTVEPAAEVLAEFGVPMEVGVVSAHRTPERMLDYAREAHTRGIKVIIACAGGAAHLPGMIAAATPLPVIGVPRALGNLDGLDSLLSIVQMPAGVPTATVSIDGAKNAGLLAVRTLAVADDSLMVKMVDYQEDMRDTVLRKDEALRQRLMGSGEA